MTVLTFPGVQPPERTPAELPIIEPSLAPEFFCGNLARVTAYGSFVRLVWSVPEIPLECASSEVQNIVNVKIVVPTTALQAIYEAIGKKLPEVMASSEGDKPHGSDPVFAAIDLHNRLDSASNALLCRELSPDEDGYEKWQAESEAATAAWSAARDELFKTVPTTRAGAMALIGMLDREDPAPEDMALLVRTLAEAVPSR